MPGEPHVRFVGADESPAWPIVRRLRLLRAKAFRPDSVTELPQRSVMGLAAASVVQDVRSALVIACDQVLIIWDHAEFDARCAGVWF